MQPCQECIKLREYVKKIGNVHEEEERLWAEKVAVLEKRYPENNPWGVLASLKKLAEAASILLKDKDYDGDGWELIQHAMESAQEIVKAAEGEEVRQDTSNEEHTCYIPNGWKNTAGIPPLRDCSGDGYFLCKRCAKHEEHP